MKRVSMRSGWAVLVIVIASSLLWGCRGTLLNPKSDLELRYDAAIQESVTADRDKSLASIAVDSAEEGNYRLTKQSMAKIQDARLRDKTAAESAARLVRAGNRAEANKLALTIKNPLIRTNTLRRLADNDVAASESTTQPAQ